MVYAGKNIGLKAYGSKKKKESEPWWKRTIKKSINKVRKQMNIFIMNGGFNVTYTCHAAHSNFNTMYFQFELH